jgi:hypothetical protein
MMIAPVAAIIISISIENGIFASAAIVARRAIGTRPTSVAAVNIQDSSPGANLPVTQATAKAVPEATATHPLADFHQGFAAGPRSREDRSAADASPCLADALT